MTYQDVIDWQLEQLNYNSNAQPSPEMQDFITANPELKQELAFIKQFWNGPKQEQQPSQRLDTNFYNMLSQAQSVEASRRPKPVTKVLSLQEWLKHWFSPKYMTQAAALGFMFVLGFNFQPAPSQAPVDPGLQSLQQEVSSLTSMLAISMLQKSSAAERLTGVAYSQQSDLTNPELMDTLMLMLGTDKSTSVRLAILNTLNSAQSISAYEDVLLPLAINEKNALVQIELCRLLLNKGSNTARNELLTQLNSMKLDKDVKDFINKINALSQV